MTRDRRAILPDTSAWAELYRRTGSSVHRVMTELLREPTRVAVTEPVLMELLAGRRPVRELARIRRRLLSFTMLRVGGLDTYERAAAIHRACSSHGETIRNSVDCLIAAVAIREGASILHRDRDFEIIARHTPLRIYPVEA
jgi:hypothetical protein